MPAGAHPREGHLRAGDRSPVRLRICVHVCVKEATFAHALLVHRCAYTHRAHEVCARAGAKGTRSHRVLKIWIMLETGIWGSWAGTQKNWVLRSTSAVHSRVLALLTPHFDSSHYGRARLLPAGKLSLDTCVLKILVSNNALVCHDHDKCQVTFSSDCLPQSILSQILLHIYFYATVEPK